MGPGKIQRGFHDDVIKWKQFPRYWPFVRGIHRSPANSPHKGQWRGALMFSLICVWINGWVNNHKAGYLRRDRAHYDISVMFPNIGIFWWPSLQLLLGEAVSWVKLYFYCLANSWRHILGFKTVCFSKYAAEVSMAFWLIWYNKQLFGKDWWPSCNPMVLLKNKLLLTNSILFARGWYLENYHGWSI